LTGIEANDTFSYDPTGSQFYDLDDLRIKVADFDLVLLRLPFPMRSEFFQFLGGLVDQRRVINRPSGIEITGSKAFLLNLQEVCPPIELCQNLDQVVNFHQKYDLVLKPLRSYGGIGILRLKNGILSGTANNNTPIEEAEILLEEEFARGGFLAMRYLTNVDQGDKRIVVVNGKIAGASLRIPPKGSWLCNVSQGGKSEGSVATSREESIAKVIHQKVGPLGIGIFGMDTLVDDDGQRVLSEINTMSVGGIGPMDGQLHRSVSMFVANELIEYFKSNMEI
jgi:glutathione synthase